MYRALHDCRLASMHAKHYLPLGLSNDIHMNTKSQDYTAGQQRAEGVLRLRRGELSTVAVTDIKEHDVLLGRGKSNANHIGNVLFQGKPLYWKYCGCHINKVSQYNIDSYYVIFPPDSNDYRKL